MGGRLGRRASLVLRVAVLAVGLSTILVRPSEAGVWCWLFGGGSCKGGGSTGHGSSPRGAPEIDPNALAGAIAIAAGGVAMLGDRIRRRR